jgi:dihydroneopterin aldolase
VADDMAITIAGIELRGRCGVSAEERALGQTIVIDVRFVPLSVVGAVSDELAGTIDYGAVVDLVRGAVEGHEYHLIERLATVITDRLWAAFALAETAVTVHKPAPPVSVAVDEARVEVVRST